MFPISNSHLWNQITKMPALLHRRQTKHVSGKAHASELDGAVPVLPAEPVAIPSPTEAEAARVPPTVAESLLGDAMRLLDTLGRVEPDLLRLLKETQGEKLFHVVMEGRIEDLKTEKRLSWLSSIVSLFHDLTRAVVPQGWRSAPPPLAASALTHPVPFQSRF